MCIIGFCTKLTALILGVQCKYNYTNMFLIIVNTLRRKTVRKYVVKGHNQLGVTERLI